MKDWLPFEVAREVARRDAKKYNVNGWNKWQNNYVKNNKIPLNIPRQPHRVYKNKGWISWGDWLGTGNIRNGSLKRLSFKKAFSVARKIIKKNDIRTKKEWFEFCKNNKIPDGIPVCPNNFYKNKGWRGWIYWTGNIGPLNNKKRYVVNHDYFKKWSHNMSYILGFWFADGCLKEDKGHKYFSISQIVSDGYLMKLFLKEMGSDYPIREYKNCLYFTIKSEKIYNDIVRLGGKRRKSLDVKFPNIPRKYLPDFVRGVFDGDGCIHYSKKNNLYTSVICSASKDFICGLFNSLQENVGVNGFVAVRKYNLSTIYDIRLSKNDTIRLGKFIYSTKSKLFLRRKKDKFEKAGNIAAKFEAMDFDLALRFTRSLKLKSRSAWQKYWRENKIPLGLSMSPFYHYKNKGWIGWAHWLGTTNKKNNTKHLIDQGDKHE